MARLVNQVGEHMYAAQRSEGSRWHQSEFGRDR
jgi:hypothetical protein